MTKSHSIKKGGGNAQLATPSKPGMLNSFWSMFTSKKDVVDESKINKINSFLKQSKPTNFVNGVIPNQLSNEGKTKFKSITQEATTPQNMSTSGGARITKRQKLKKRKTRRHI